MLYTLLPYGREDILSLEPKEALDALISHFANDGNTIDDKIALDSMVETVLNNHFIC